MPITWGDYVDNSDVTSANGYQPLNFGPLANKGLYYMTGQDGLLSAVDPNSGQWVPINQDGSQDMVRSQSDDWLSDLVGGIATLGLGTAAFGVGGATGAAAATGNDVGTGMMLDLGGLAAAPVLGGAGLGMASTVGAADTAAAAGAMGGAAGQAGGGLSALEAGGGLAGLSGAAGATAGPGAVDLTSGGLMEGEWDFGGMGDWGFEGVGGEDFDFGGFDWGDVGELGMDWLGGQLAPNGQGMNWLGLGSDMLGYAAMRDYQQGLLGAMDKAINYSDPAYAQRGFYQDMYKNMQTDPNWMQNDSVLQNMMDYSMDNVAANKASQGYLGSGNMMHDLTRTANQTVAPYALQRMQQVGQAGGLFNGPGNTSTFGTLANQAGQAGLGQMQQIQKMAGRIPQQQQTGLNNQIGGLLGSIGSEIFSL